MTREEAKALTSAQFNKMHEIIRFRAAQIARKYYAGEDTGLPASVERKLIDDLSEINDNRCLYDEIRLSIHCFLVEQIQLSELQ